MQEDDTTKLVDIERFSFEEEAARECRLLQSITKENSVWIQRYGLLFPEDQGSIWRNIAHTGDEE